MIVRVIFVAMWRPWQEEQHQAEEDVIEENLPSNNNEEGEIEENLPANNDEEGGEGAAESDGDEEVPSLSTPQRRTRKAVDKNLQEVVINVHRSFVGQHSKSPIADTARTVGLCTKTVSKILNRGPKTPQKKGRKDARFSKVDDFEKGVIRDTIYRSFSDRVVPTLMSTFLEVKQRLPDFPYELAHFKRIVSSLGFRCQSLGRRNATLKSPRLRKSREHYLKEISKVRVEGKVIVYLDETWYDTHDVKSKGLSDGTPQCYLKTPVSGGNG